MNVQGTMRIYQQVVNYYRKQWIRYFKSLRLNYKEGENSNRLFYHFLLVVEFHDMFVGVVTKRDPIDVLQDMIEKYRDEYDEILKKYTITKPDNKSSIFDFA